MIQGKNKVEPHWPAKQALGTREGGKDVGGEGLGGDIGMMWPESGDSVWSLSVCLPQLAEACLTPCSSSVLGSPVWVFRWLNGL